MKKRTRFRTSNSRGSDNIFGRIFRAGISMIVLTAFVLGITFTVRQMASFNLSAASHFFSPYLARVGLDEDSAGQVAGKFFERVSHTGIGDLVPGSSSNSGDTIVENQKDFEDFVAPEGEAIFSVAIISDSHIANDKQEYINNKDHLKRALELAKEKNVHTVIHAGDLTNWGTLNDLREAKRILDGTELSYYVLPGDRDLAQSVGTSNFLNVFNSNNYAFEIEGTKFVLLDNSANYTQISQESMGWFKNQIENTDFVILSQPLYSEGFLLFKDLYMGSSNTISDENLAAKQDEVKKQRDELLGIIRNSNVKAVFAGDHHRSDKGVDNDRASLIHYIVGATSEVVSDLPSGVLLQPQKFTLLTVYENGGYKVEDVLL